MNVFKIADEGYDTWVVASTEQEAIQFYKEEVVGDEDLELVVSELTSEELDKEKVAVDTDEDDNPSQWKTFREILTENEDAEDKSPWVIA